MRPWRERSTEEAHLLNPSFCSLIISSAVGGHVEAGEPSMSYPLAFLVLPAVLHKATRERLPRGVNTALSNWLEEHSDLLLRFPDRARSLAPFTREAILFGVAYHMIQVLADGTLMYGPTVYSTKQFLAETTDEVRDCVKKARFVGRWFAKAGSPATVMALWGVAP
jgi:hypothetical protein